MTTPIPHARGLTEELSSRVRDLLVNHPTEKMAPDGIHKVTQYEVFGQDRRLGVVEVNSWDFRGITQFEHVTYEGVIPGYNGEKVIGMTATADYNLGNAFDTPIGFGLNDNTRPNDTWDKPLYRHDGHRLRLADYEVNGEGRKRTLAIPEDEVRELIELGRLVYSEVERSKEVRR